MILSHANTALQTLDRNRAERYAAGTSESRQRIDGYFCINACTLPILTRACLQIGIFEIPLENWVFGGPPDEWYTLMGPEQEVPQLRVR